jgi:hypothetical protein
MPDDADQAGAWRLGTLSRAWRFASIFDFFSSPLGGNSAWAAASSREISTEKTSRPRLRGVT